MSTARSKPRFAMVCPNYYPVTCGVGDYSMRLASELMRRGAEVALFTHAPARPNPECSSVEIHEGAGRTPLEIVGALEEKLRAFGPSELVIQYMPNMLLASRFGSPAIPALMSQMRGSARVTVVFHEFYIPWSLRPDLALAATLQRLQFGAVVGASDRVFVTTEPRKRRLEALLRKAGRERLVEVMYVGANATPVTHRTRGGGPRIGIFSMLARTRPFDVMVDAFALVHQRFPDAELVLIGNLGTNASPLYRALKAHIDQSSARQRIRLTGALPLARVAEEVAALDVYLLPDETGANTRSSTLPIALGSGIPVVATRGPETATDFFIDGRNIAFAPNLTAPELASVVFHVLGDPAWAARLGAGGRLLYEQHLTWSAIADHLMPRGMPTEAPGTTRAFAVG